jgi:histidine triad (HIT) family protein
MVENKLSEEEIKKRIEMMKENCIFCKIVKGEIESKVVFEDDLCIAILDINPVSNGHLLLIPKEHYMMMPMVPDEVLGHLSVISKSLSDLLMESLDCKDVLVLMSNGAAAGQQIQHFCINLIPRYDEDGLNFNFEGENDAVSQEELENLANKLKERLRTTNKT